MGSARVLVVGAGPVGLSTACELRRRDVPVRLIDASAGPSDKSKAVAVQPRTLHAFDAMGVAARFVAAGRRVHGLNAYADGTRIVHVTLDDVDSPYSYVLSLPQNETERLLSERLRELGVEVEREVRLAGLSQDADHVTATLAHAGGPEERLEVGWVVGCDGAHSTVRQSLGVAFEGPSRTEELTLADVRVSWALPDDEAHVFLSSDGALLAVPIPLGRWRLIAEGATEEPSLAYLTEVMRRLGGPLLQLRYANWMGRFHAQRRVAAAYRVGRVFLAGDAAHVHSPMGGHGMNAGIQDAFNLGWKLALVDAGRGQQALLDSYHPERHPVSAATLTDNPLATEAVTLRTEVSDGVRDRLAGVLSGLEVVQMRVLAHGGETPVEYRNSPIVDQAQTSLGRATVNKRVGEGPTVADWVGFGSAPQPGDRAPDVRIDDSTQLVDLLRHERSTLLLFDGAAPTPEGYANLAGIARRVRERWDAAVRGWIVIPRRARPAHLEGEPNVLLDVRGALHRRYGAGSECLYLIRPDGYVGFRSQPAIAKALEAHLASLFT